MPHRVVARVCAAKFFICVALYGLLGGGHARNWFAHARGWLGIAPNVAVTAAKTYFETCVRAFVVDGAHLQTAASSRAPFIQVIRVLPSQS